MSNWYKEKILLSPNYRTTNIISDISLLYPPFSFSIIKLFAEACKFGLRIRVFETYRSKERQASLYQQGRTKIKTNGMHHFGVAADVVYRDSKNNPIWKGDWKKLGQIGKKIGLYWGGDWKDFVDSPHFQFIPALVKDQGKIIKQEYPLYDKTIDKYLETLMPLFDKIKTSGYSDETIKKLIKYCDEISQNKVGPAVTDISIIKTS